MRLRNGWLFLSSLGLQVLAIYGSPYIPKAIFPFTLGVTYALLLGGLLLNLNFWGSRLLLVGFVLNLLAMVLNSWYMPVNPEVLLRAGFSQEASLLEGSYLIGSKSVVLARDDTKLWFLADLFPITKPIRIVFSPGDLIILLAVVLLIWEVARRPHKVKTLYSPKLLTSLRDKLKNLV